jgi:DNA-binding HxlR family transcriptional regulator
VGDKWTLLIIRDLASGPRRFVELQRVLPGISTEQLRSRLNRMVADGMLTRKRYREVPPRVDYELTERAHDLMPVLGALARWGYEWAWSEPRSAEAVDIGAIFRLAPGLLDASEREERVDFQVTDTGTVYSVTLTPEGATLTERAGASADTHVRGSTAAWVAAFSPAQDRTGLEVSGDSALAARVLAALSASATGQAGRARTIAAA